MAIKNTRNIIGREKEKQKLSQFLNSGKAEFMVEDESAKLI